MSYIRYGSELKYVEGTSDCYIFPTEDDGHSYIEDYDKISDKVLVEMIARYLEEDKRFPEWKIYLIEKLAERLKVKLMEDKNAKSC